MSDLAHFTVTTGNLIMSPRTEVDERTMELLKPIVRAGFGIVAGLSIFLESHIRHNDSETWVFTLGYKPDVPAARCWLSRSPKRTCGNSGSPSRRRPGLQSHCWTRWRTSRASRSLALGDAERCVAWAFLEATLPC